MIMRVDWFHFATDREESRALMNTVMNAGVSIKYGEFY